MLNLTTQGQAFVAGLAAKYGVSQDAVTTILQALGRGAGRSAQFSHPDFGGQCQWMAGGMTMTPDLFDHGLKSKVDGLCTELAGRLFDQPDGFVVPETPSRLGPWWPAPLGTPASAASQNNIRYALFPDKHRLAVEVRGRVTVYDTRGHQIGGLTQMGSGDETTLTFHTPQGALRLTDLPLVEGRPGETEPDAEKAAPEPAKAAPAATAPSGHDDVLDTLERLAALKAKGILTDEEFTAKKAELLGRL